ncbi:MAG: PAS domain-containing protein [Myxococcales bacterium]|nr:PAS domain-containing protein [Myxococcales bacterium]
MPEQEQPATSDATSDELVAQRDELLALRRERDALARRCESLEQQLNSSSSELRRNQRLLHYIAEHAPAVIYVKDLEGRFLLSNNLHARLLGLEREQIIGRREQDFLSAEEAAAIDEVSRRVASTRELAVHEFQVTLGDGRHWFLEQIFPLAAEDGELFAIGGIATDVSIRKRAEEQLAITRELIEHSPDIVIVSEHPITGEGSLRLVNDAGASQLGAPARVAAWLAARFAGDAGRAFRAAIERGEVWRETLRFEGDAGERILDASGFLIRETSDFDAACAWIMRDITESTRLASERAALQRRVIAAQEAALEELSVPLLPLAHGVLVLPLLGRYNGQRREQLIAILTEGVVTNQARVVLLDVTGLRDVDVEMADALHKIARATRLLGASIVMTGVTPETARALVEHDVALPGVIMRRTLGDGLLASGR